MSRGKKQTSNARDKTGELKQTTTTTASRTSPNKTIAVHVHYKSLCISLPSPAKQNNVKWPSSPSSTERGRRRQIFRISVLELNAVVAYLA